MRKAVNWYKADGTYIKTSRNGQDEKWPALGESRVDYTATAPPEAARATFYHGHEGGTTQLDEGETFECFADMAQVEEGEEATPDFPRAHQLESGQAVWTGTEHESSSKLATPTNHPASKEGDAGEGEEPVEVVEGVEGLKSQTTYHYRVYWENSEGQQFGEDKTFTTGLGLSEVASSGEGVPPAFGRDYWLGDTIAAHHYADPDAAPLELTGRVTDATVTERESGQIQTKVSCSPEIAVSGVTGEVVTVLVPTEAE